MHKKFTLVALVICVVFSSFATSAFATSAQVPSSTNDDVQIDRAVTDVLKTKDTAHVVVELSDYTTHSLASSQVRDEQAQDIDQIIDDANIDEDVTKEFSRLPALATTVDEDQLESLSNDPRVASIRLSKRYTLEEFREGSFTAANFESAINHLDYSKPLLNQVVPLIQADDAWARTTPRTGDNQKIIVIDTGVDTSHPFLSGAVVSERCYAQGPDGIGGTGACPNGLDTQTGSGSAAPCTTVSSCSHGTHVAGIAAGRRSVSGAPTGGIAPNADIVSIQVFGTYSGSATCGTGVSTCILAEDTDVLSALQWVLANPTNVAAVNLSLGGGGFTTQCDSQDPSTATAIQTLATTHSIATVVASGNAYSSTQVSWPACFSYAIAVGSTTKSDVVSDFTSSNSLIRLWSTGSSVRSSIPMSFDTTDGTADGYQLKSGTSMAAPGVSAAFAILREANPSESWTQRLQRLELAGVSITDSRNSVTRPRIAINDALDEPAPQAPSAPSSATLTAQYGYGTLSWASVGNATSYKIYNSANALINTVGASTTSLNVATSFNVATHYSVSAANTTGESSKRVSNSIVGKAGASHSGYAFFGSNGAVVGQGVFAPYTRGPLRLNRPVVGGATSPNLNGGWAVAGDGGIFTFGSVNFLGGTGGMKLNQPIVGMASTPSGNGYWLVASDGGIFTFGDAQFYGGTGGMKLNRPILGMASTPSGRGYWLVASDGGMFSFGDAQFYGSTGGMKLNQPIVAMTSTPSGRGYWLVASDGGIFTFGDAQFYGGTGGMKLNQPIIGMKESITGNGYWLFASDGGVFTFGDAAFLGSGVGHGYSYPSAK